MQTRNSIKLVEYVRDNQSDIKQLNLSGSQLDMDLQPLILYCLSYNKHLKILDLTDTDIDGDFVCKLARSLATRSALKKIILSFNSIGDEAALSLSKIYELNALEISNTDITDQGVQAPPYTLFDYNQVYHISILFYSLEGVLHNKVPSLNLYPLSRSCTILKYFSGY